MLGMTIFAYLVLTVIPSLALAYSAAVDSLKILPLAGILLVTIHDIAARLKNGYKLITA